jgi:hypothetical protein
MIVFYKNLSKTVSFVFAATPTLRTFHLRRVPHISILKCGPSSEARTVLTRAHRHAPEQSTQSKSPTAAAVVSFVFAVILSEAKDPEGINPPQSLEPFYLDRVPHISISRCGCLGQIRSVILSEGSRSLIARAAVEGPAVSKAKTPQFRLSSPQPSKPRVNPAQSRGVVVSLHPLYWIQS